MDAPEPKSLPENAYRELKRGETYAPIVPASEAPPETTVRSILWGVFFCVVFTVASAYSGLKVGQVMEAAIPISILAIGLARLYARRSTLLENVIVTSIGGSAGSVAAGAIFTLPALYALDLHPHPLQTIFICLAGAVLGVLFMIPLRRYFVRDMHGSFPFPEATAITEVLVTGEKGGSQARLLVKWTILSAAYDFFVTTFHVWREVLDFQFLPFMKKAAAQAKVVLRFDAIAFILGLGYVMGLRSSMILCAGGVLSNLVLVPLIFMIGQGAPDILVHPGAKPIAVMSATEIFRGYVRFIGVGAIATAGIFGVLKSLRIIAGSFSVAAKALKAGRAEALDRTDRDISMTSQIAGIVGAAVAAAAFLGTLQASPSAIGVGLVLILVFAFLFTSVAANAIATVARNPISGMTMLTIIISSVVLLRFGLSGRTGMFFVMAIAGMVCTALSVSGQTITDLKTGYWLGSTPAAQERVKFLGAIVASVAAGATVVVLARLFQFGEQVTGDTRAVLEAPQASIMKALVQSFMNEEPVAVILFGAGAAVAVVIEMLGVPALPFALGMYLPLELNTPALVGGVLAHWVGRRADRAGGVDGARGRTMRERGIIVASGLMAGGALGGVFGAALRLHPRFSEGWVKTPFFENDPASQLVSAAFFLGLCVWVWREALKRVPAAKENP